MLGTEYWTSITATLGGGFFTGVLIGYALMKAVKLAAVVFGLFLAGSLSSVRANNLYKMGLMLMLPQQN
jgi:uncharacterized membrane protein (Fun14 family)